jgi:hypothetical protein
MHTLSSRQRGAEAGGTGSVARGRIRRGRGYGERRIVMGVFRTRTAGKASARKEKRCVVASDERVRDVKVGSERNVRGRGRGMWRRYEVGERKGLGEQRRNIKTVGS